MAPALRLLAALDWHGPAMVEFKDPGKGRRPILMEINGRLWGSLPLAVAAGINFPRLLAQLFLALPLHSPNGYAVGVHCRHLRGDLSHLVGVLKGPPPYWQGTFPGRVGTLLSVLAWPGRWRTYNFRFGDPLPGLVEGGDFVLKELSRLAALIPVVSR